MAIVCAGSMAIIPAFLKRQAEKKKQAPPPTRRKRKSTGRIGTKKAKHKDEPGKKEKRK
jgi:hypothetical protein